MKDQATARVFKTKLKFVPSEKTGEMIAYVNINTVNGQILGVGQDTPVQKKIVLLSEQVSKTLEVTPKVLYDVEMVPMGKGQNKKSCKGFIVVSLIPSLFDATITTGKGYQVSVTFGNKTIEFDPQSSRASRSDINNVLELIEERIEIRDKHQVIQEFKEKAAEVCKRYEESFEDRLELLQGKYEAA